MANYTVLKAQELGKEETHTKKRKISYDRQNMNGWLSLWLNCLNENLLLLILFLLWAINYLLTYAAVLAGGS